MSRASSWPKTDRLHLRPWEETEAARLLDIRKRREVAKWLSDPTPWTELSTALEKIADWRLTTRGPGPLGVWAIVPEDAETGTMVPAGTVSLGQLPRSQEVEIGWYLHPDSSGKGYAAEAAGALLDRALACGLANVWAIMWPENEASARVARSIGMEDLGVVDDPWYGTESDPKSRMFRAARESRVRPHRS